MNEELSLSEVQELETEETIIENGLEHFLEVGNALIRIKDKKLYRKYGTWEKYCLERWGFTDKHGRELRRAAETIQGLGIKIEPEGLVSPNISMDAVLELGNIEDKNERLLVYHTLKEIAQEKPITTPMVKAAITVVEDADTTGGYVDVGDGHMRAFTAAVTQRISDRKDKQLDHIRAKLGPSNELKRFEGTCQEVLTQLSTWLIENPDKQQVVVKAIFYEVKENNHEH